MSADRAPDDDAGNVAWLLERHAPDDFVHACLALGVLHDPLSPDFPTDPAPGEATEAQFEAACEAFLDVQRPATLSRLLDENCWLARARWLRAFALMLAVDVDELTWPDRERRADRLDGMREEARAMHLARPVRAAAEGCYWQLHCQREFRRLVGPHDDAGDAVAFSAADLEFLREFERELGLRET